MRLPIRNFIIIHCSHGTEYIAPEVIRNMGHSASVDWWTLGTDTPFFLLIWSLLSDLSIYHFFAAGILIYEMIVRDSDFFVPFSASMNLLTFLPLVCNNAIQRQRSAGNVLKCHYI